MGPWEALAIVGAGIGAGGVNAVVGSGTLITFPVLLTLGYAPVTATISNTVGIAPGALAGAIGYRHELRGQRPRVLRFGVMSLLGAVTGGTLLLLLPPEVFTAVVPVLIILACALITLQPRLNARVRRRSPERSRGGALLPLGVYAAGVYGGYFAAAQGVLLLGLLGSALPENLQRVNALKNTLTFVVNTTAALFYAVFAAPVWPAVALIAVGSVLGGYLGAVLGRRLKPLVLRVLVIVVGLTAVGELLTD